MIRKAIIVVLTLAAFTTGFGWALSFQWNLNVWRYDRTRGVLRAATVDDGWLRITRQGGVFRILCAYGDYGDVRGSTWGTNEYIVSLGKLAYMTEPDPQSAALYRMQLLPFWPIPLPLAIYPVVALWKRIRLVLLAALIPTALAWKRLRRPLLGYCRNCGYDLTGNVTGTCSECGTAITAK